LFHALAKQAITALKRNEAWIHQLQNVHLICNMALFLIITIQCAPKMLHKSKINRMVVIFDATENK
jgi:hypothetical protein